VQTLLERVARLTVLVTSRQRLGLPGEHQFSVPPLPVPAAIDGRWPMAGGPARPGLSVSEPSTISAQLSTNASVRLFVDRAQAVRPEFQVTAANSAAVAALCARLEGLPLALVLAAARIGVLNPEQMLVWLEQRFEFLVSREPLADRRHQSLRAVLDGSFQLLDPELQRFFARLSVFQGGWTLEAAEAVADFGLGIAIMGLGHDPSAIPKPQSPSQNRTLAHLEQLRECSLVLAEEPSVGHGENGCPGGAPTGAGIRFRLLETIREYARDRLLEAGEIESARQCHRDFYLEWAAQSRPGSSTCASQQARLDRLEAECGNLRVALAWSIERGEAATALRLANVLGQLWSLRGYITEGRERLAAVLALPGAQEHTEALALALNYAGNLALDQGDHSAARAFYEEALVIYRELGKQFFIAGLLHNLGGVSLHQGDYARARACFEDNLARWRGLGEKGGIAATLGNLAKVARGEGDYERAVALGSESLALGRELGDASLVCPALQFLGHAALLQGDHARARVLFQESLALDPEGGSLPDIARTLSGLAGVAGGEGFPEQAALLLGAAVALLDRMGVVLSAADRAEHDRSLAAVRAALDEKAFAAAWIEGRAMPLESVIALALAER